MSAPGLQEMLHGVEHILAFATTVKAAGKVII
jgi:hypothetical protein